MLNKTNGILTEGVEESGTITKINVNEGKYYYIQVSLDKGGTEGIQATLGEFPGLCRQYDRNHLSEQAERRG